jgi:hypothetical protein
LANSSDIVLGSSHLESTVEIMESIPIHDTR